MKSDRTPTPRAACLDLPALALALALLPVLAVAAPAARAGARQAEEGPAAAQAPPTGDATFFESLDVNVVNVEVYVTGKDGRPVTGLTADDFEVLEDGRPMTISNFYTVEEGRPAAPAGQPAPPAAPAAEPAPVRPPGRPVAPAPPPPDQRLHLILYFDNLQLRPFDRNRVAREVRAFLADHVQPDDRVMVVTFERSLHVRQPFTSDLKRVQDALGDMEKLSGFAVQAASERDQLLRRIDSTDEMDAIESAVDFYAKSVYDDVRGSVRALKDLVGSLGGLPGRKALLYVSDGIPLIAAEDLFHLLDLRFGALGQGRLMSMRYSARNDFRELAASANANRVTFYTLDAQGLHGQSGLSAEHGGRNAGGSFAEVDLVRDANLSAPLQMMAEDTGGQAAFNTNNFSGALERMAMDFGAYYSLGYVPAHSGDGRYHKIEVRVRSKGVDVRHRAGYRDKTLEARLGEGALAALLHGVENDPLGLQVALGSGRARDDGYYLVPLEVAIPLGRITLVPQGETFRGQLRVVVAVVDRDGETSPPEQTTIPIEIPAADLEGARSKSFVYAVDLLSRRGEHEVAVGVRDELAGETAFVRKGFLVR